MNEHQDAAGRALRLAATSFLATVLTRGLQARSECSLTTPDFLHSVKSAYGTRFLSAWLLEDTHLHLRTNAHHSTKAHAQDSRSLVAC